MGKHPLVAVMVLVVQSIGLYFRHWLLSLCRLLR